MELIINLPTYPHPINPNTIYSSILICLQILNTCRTYATKNYFTNLIRANSGLVFGLIGIFKKL
jgi:hypothetical protein